MTSRHRAWEVVEGDCFDVLKNLPGESVDAIITDPPYFRVKNEAWDKQWDTAAGFVAWIAELATEWRRVLKPNGSLYVFASPRMAARVECAIGEEFNVLNRIRWIKAAGWHNKARKEALRSFLSPWEEIVFAEQYGADGSALRGSGYEAACAELHAGVFEPIRSYLAGERDRAGFTNRQVDGHLGTNGMAGHYFGASQWALPTEAVYERMRGLFNARGDYEYLRRDYEYLRRDYEELRRPFQVTADVPYTDVWTFDPVKAYAGKHPCEKPQALLRHVLESSTRPDALVLDCFAGTGSLGLACQAVGRRFLGIEREGQYVAQARRRLEAAHA